jgi:hypothetical protein
MSEPYRPPNVGLNYTICCSTSANMPGFPRPPECGSAKCAYCGLVGTVGSRCDGCGSLVRAIAKREER